MTERPALCLSKHPMTWYCDHLGVCSEGTYRFDTRVGRWQRIKTGSEPIYEVLWAHIWSCRVGTLLGTTDPTEGAAKLVALIEAARFARNVLGNQSYWGPGSAPGDAWLRLKSALAALPAQEARGE